LPWHYALITINECAAMTSKTTIPTDSALSAFQSGADYSDAFEAPLHDGRRSALYRYLEFAARTPKWIDFLMVLRNAAVRPFALKGVGKLANVPPVSAAGDLRAGDRVGIFTIRTVCDTEVVLEIIDSHLDVLVSVYKEDGAAPKVKVITMVFYHNWLGRLYMIPVAPMHRIVVKSILSSSHMGSTS
jgi:hypothetical protein